MQFRSIGSDQARNHYLEERHIPGQEKLHGARRLRSIFFSLLIGTVVLMMIISTLTRYKSTSYTKRDNELTVPINFESHNILKSTVKYGKIHHLETKGSQASRQPFRTNVWRKESATRLPASAKSTTRVSVPVPPNTRNLFADTGTPRIPRVLVVAYFRSGSTFLGDALSQDPATFYHYEPLSVLHNDHTKPAHITPLCYKTVENIFRCNFEHAPEYLKEGKSFFFPFERNKALWSRCKGDINACFRPEFISSICNASRMQVMKVTRLRLRHVLELIRNNDDLRSSIKVIHLVRDPRGIWASRLREVWCTYEMGCKDIQTLCQEMRDDINRFLEVKEILHDRLTRVHYEDIALNPEAGIKRLLSRLGLNYTVHASKFLRTHTLADDSELNNSFSTKRNSRKTVFRWTHWLSYTEVVKLQEACPDVFQSLGYPIALSEAGLRAEVEKVFIKRRKYDYI